MMFSNVAGSLHEAAGKMIRFEASDVVPQFCRLILHLESMK